VALLQAAWWLMKSLVLSASPKGFCLLVETKQEERCGEEATKVQYCVAVDAVTKVFVFDV